MRRFLSFKARDKAIPISGSFELTPLCNLDCKMCYVRLSALEQQMTCTALPMAQLWRRLAASDAYGRCRLLTDTAAALDHLPFDAAFRAAVERAWTEDLLTPAGRQLLTEFGAGCGRYDMERQSTHIRLYTAALTALDEELAAEAVAKGRLYRVLGAAGGAALVLLLL